MERTREHSTVDEVDIPELPAGAIANIVQNLPVKSRLTCCALVSQTWKAATASTAVHIVDYNITVLRAGKLQSWLQHSGNQVISLQLEHSEDPVVMRPALQLPCPQLTRLHTLSLANIDLQLHTDAAPVSTSRLTEGACGLDTSPGPGARLSSSLVPAAAGMLPQLQHLHLAACRIPLDSFLQLSQLTQLTYLHVMEVCVTAGTSAPAKPIKPAQMSAAIQTVMRQLTSLVHLTLIDFEGYFPSTYSAAAAVAALQPLGNMQRLRRLELDKGACPDMSELLPVLPASLVKLHTSQLRCKQLCSGSCQHLTSLVDLTVISNVFDPSVLEELPQLQSLHLENAELVGHGRVFTDAGAFSHQVQGTDWLLHIIGRLTALQDLVLTDMALDQHSPIQQLSALTASSELRSLCIVDGGGEDGPLPPQALEHLFPAGKQMPNFRELYLEADLFYGAQYDTSVVCVTPADIQRICHACSGLQRLCLVNVVAADVIDSLRGLPQSMRELEVAGSALGDSAISAITHLTGLQELMWMSRTLTSAGVRQLGATFQGLTRLVFANNEGIPAFDGHRCPVLDWSQAYGANECELLTAAEAQELDVWKQLQDGFRQEDARQELLAKQSPIDSGAK